MPMQYWDRYERRDGDWFFKSRKPVVFYAADVLQHPLQVEDRFHFPDNPMLDKAELPGALGDLAGPSGPAPAASSRPAAAQPTPRSWPSQ